MNADESNGKICRIASARFREPICCFDVESDDSHRTYTTNKTYPNELNKCAEIASAASVISWPLERFFIV